LVYRS